MLNKFVDFKNLLDDSVDGETPYSNVLPELYLNDNPLSISMNREVACFREKFLERFQTKIRSISVVLQPSHSSVDWTNEIRARVYEYACVCMCVCIYV